MTVLMLAIPLTLIVLAQDLRHCHRDIGLSGGFGPALGVAGRTWEPRSTLAFFAYVVAIIATTYAVGQLTALPLFVAVYARRWGQSSWTASVVYAALCLLAVWFVYVKIMNLALHPSLFFGG